MKMFLVRHRLSVALVSAVLTLCSPAFGQDTTDLLSKALDLVHQAEKNSGKPPTDALRIDLLTQAIKMAQQAPNHRLQGHRVLAIQAIRSAIAEVRAGDPNHQAATYLHTADQELSTSISLAGGAPPPTTATGSVTSTPAPAAQTADDYINLGWARMNQSDWHGAVADFDQAIKLDPTKVDAYLKRGTAKLNQNDCRGAEVDFDQVIKLDPTKVEAYLERGSCKQILGDRDSGTADYDQAIKLDPKNTETYLTLGEALLMRDPKAAIAYYEKVIALDPKNDRAYEGIANVHRMHQENDEAIAAYDRLIAVDPKYWPAYGIRAIVKEGKGDLDGAIADYDQDILLEPTDFNAFRNRAQLKEKKGDLEGALADFNQAFALGLNDAYTYRRRATVKKALGDLDGALADYNQVISLDPKNDDGFVNLDEIYAARGDVKLAKRDCDGAITDYKQAIALMRGENTDQDYFNIWVAQNLQGKKADADAQLSSEMANSLGFDWYWHGNIARFLLGQINEADFMNAATSPDAKKTGICQAWYYAGIKQLLAGNKSTAADDFRKCLATNQKDESAYFFAQAELKAMEKQP